MIGASRLPATMCLLSNVFSATFGEPLTVTTQHDTTIALPSPKLPTDVMKSLACSPDGIPWDVGRMPITKVPMTGDQSGHRMKVPEHSFLLPALVTRPVSKKEVKQKLA